MSNSRFPHSLLVLAPLLVSLMSLPMTVQAQTTGDDAENIAENIPAPQSTWSEAGITPGSRPSGPHIHVRAPEVPQERLRRYVVAAWLTPPDWSYDRPEDQACAVDPATATWQRQLFILPEFFVEVLSTPILIGDRPYRQPQADQWAIGTYQELPDGSLELVPQSCLPTLYVGLTGPEGVYTPKLAMADLRPWQRPDGSMAFTAALPEDFPPPDQSETEELPVEESPDEAVREPYRVQAGGFVLLDWTPPVFGDRSELRFRRGELQFGFRLFGVENLEVAALARIGLHFEAYGEPLTEFSGGLLFGGTITTAWPVAFRLYAGLLAGRGPVRLRCSLGEWGSSTVVCPPREPTADELEEFGVNYAPFDSMVQTVVIGPVIQFGASFGGQRVRFLLGVQLEVPTYFLAPAENTAVEVEVDHAMVPFRLILGKERVTLWRFGPQFGIQF